jgi:beta-glucosidase
VACPWLAEHADAILCAWYPGEEGGTAVADALFGACDPAGRLPVTFYRATADLPPFDDYAMAGRTYRYRTGPVQWPFGHGLSYTRFAYAGASARRSGRSVELAVELTNVGARAGEEVVQAYAEWPAGTEGAPLRQLVAFTRRALPRGARRRLRLAFPAARLGVADAAGDLAIPAGIYRVWIGGGQPGTGAPGVWCAVDL